MELKDIKANYVTNDFVKHYNFFLQRAMTGAGQLAFDSKFEMLLIFLVEAIGVPVLLSLLLLTYSNTTRGDVIDLDDLPEGRLQLYKFGILSGIKKRLLLNSAMEAKNCAAEGAAAEKEKRRPAPRRGERKREKRKARSSRTWAARA